MSRPTNEDFKYAPSMHPGIMSSFGNSKMSYILTFSVILISLQKDHISCNKTYNINNDKLLDFLLLCGMHAKSNGIYVKFSRSAVYPHSSKGVIMRGHSYNITKYVPV